MEYQFHTPFHLEFKDCRQQISRSVRRSSPFEQLPQAKKLRANGKE
jgi:hypothetical protein